MVRGFWKRSLAHRLMWKKEYKDADEKCGSLMAFSTMPDCSIFIQYVF